MTKERYYKKIVNGFISTIAKIQGNFDGEEITEEEYYDILEVLNSYESPNIRGKDYRLSSNLEWILVDIDPIDIPDISDSEAINMLLNAINT